MSKEENVFQALLAQQQQFTQQILSQQREWMESMLNNTGERRSEVASQTMCPAFHAFNKERQSWESYLQQLAQHFAAYAVEAEDKKKAYFLSWVGSELFELLKNLFNLDNLNACTFTQLTEKLTDHFQSKRHVVGARYEFFKCEMKHNQKHREWVAELRGIARECQFQCSATNCSSSFIDEMIRDQIIVHTPHDSIRSAALQKLKPTLEDVLLIAETYETTTKTVSTIKENKEKTLPVHSIHTHFTKKNVKEVNKEKNKLKSCSGCGKSHERDKCKFREAICYECNKKGHIAVVCMTKQTNKNKKFDKYNQKSYRYNNKDADTVETMQINSLINIGKIEANKKIIIQLEIFEKLIPFQVDSGATISVINVKTYKELNSPQLLKCNKILQAFGKIPIPVLGELHTVAKYGSKLCRVVFIVANVESSTNLFGLDLFQAFGFDIQQVANMIEDETHKIEELCSKYKEVFEPALGTIRNFKATLILKPTATPKFFKSRPIPFAQMSAFKAEAERLTQAGVWKPIKFSNWASPIVLASKPNGAIRICGDFKQGVNAQLDIEQYPLPTREVLLHKISHGKHFTKIDLKDAYLQMELDEASKEVMVVNTPLGLFQYQRLAYGIASAPAIYQRYLQQLISHVEGCGNYLDDIIITAPTTDQHISRIEQVLQILQENGIKCKKEKCKFFQEEIEYLGRKISSKGILPDDSGVKAVKNLLPPTNLQQLEAFLGKVNYYCCFIPNFSQLSFPLNKLRRKNVPFEWGPEQQQAFIELKAYIVNATQLAHFKEELPLVLATDASSYGIGAVLSQIQQDGTEQPIAFASKTLDIHQVKYSQIEKEGLSIIFGVKKFHQYLYGTKFILITDHQPLVTIFNPNKQLPVSITNRLQRWAIILMAYNFEIKYRSTSAHGNADALSRLPLGTDEDFDKVELCCNIHEISPPINAEKIRENVSSDKTLKKVLNYVQNGWPNKLLESDKDVLPYFNRKLGLTMYQDLLYLHTNTARVVIPKMLRQNILKLLHDGHWGVVKMKQTARQHVWWPGIDEDINQLASACRICMQNNAAPPKQFQCWEKPSAPWERVHLDFAGPIYGALWLVCVDAFSQFPFVVQMSTTTTSKTISALSAIFAIEGYPKILVSDNGPQLTSNEFNTFCKNKGIDHVTTAPFHPASNGLAERFVQTFKTAVKKNIDDEMPIGAAVIKFLSSYRFTPNTEGKTPAELIHGRPVRTILSQIHEQPTDKQFSQQPAKFKSKQRVYVRNFGKGEKWINGVIDKQISKMIFIVKTANGYCKRHINQIKKRSTSEDDGNNSDNNNDFEIRWDIINSQQQTNSKENADANKTITSQLPSTVQTAFEHQQQPQKN